MYLFLITIFWYHAGNTDLVSQLQNVGRIPIEELIISKKEENLNKIYSNTLAII